LGGRAKPGALGWAAGDSSPQMRAISSRLAATGWRKHSIRGFAGSVTKKVGLPISRLKNGAGDGIYRTEK